MQRHLLGGHQGLTPACAGTTASTPPRAPSDAAHPRVRGDDGTRVPVTNCPAGSPPRARGRLLGLDAAGGPDRLTPACAGTTPRPAGSSGTRRAHPRVRGDDLVTPDDRAVASGSPPRARGRRTGARGSRASRTAHPRVRGDDSTVPDHRGSAGGSPPRARGRRSAVDLGPSCAGLTPACAGTTSVRQPCPARPSAHPRVRGDDRELGLTKLGAGGSPPRARGRRFARAGRLRVVRLTPACAGTTRTPTSSTASTRAHPRVRGDDRCGAPRR